MVRLNPWNSVKIGTHSFSTETNWHAHSCGTVHQLAPHAHESIKWSAQCKLPAVACSRVKMPRLLWRWLFTHMCVLHPYTYIPLHSLLIASNMSALCSFYTRNLALVLTKKKENKYHEKCSHCYHEPLLSFPAPRPHILILFLQFILPSKTQKHSTVYNATVQPGPRVEWSTWSNEVKCFCSKEFSFNTSTFNYFQQDPYTICCWRSTDKLKPCSGLNIWSIFEWVEQPFHIFS